MDDDIETQYNKTKQVKEKEFVEVMEPPKKQELRTPMCESGSDIIDSGDTEGRNNKARERDSVGIPELPRKHALLILKHESNSDTPDSNKDMDRKGEDNKKEGKMMKRLIMQENQAQNR